MKEGIFPLLQETTKEESPIVRSFAAAHTPHIPHSLNEVGITTPSPGTVRDAWKAWGVMERLQRPANGVSPAAVMSPASFREHMDRIKQQNANMRQELSRFRSTLQLVKADITSKP